MNVSPEPEWAKKFQEYLETEYNFSKLDAMGTIGVLHQYMRKYKESINEDNLDKLTDNYTENLFPNEDNVYTEALRKESGRDFKAGYRKGWEDKI